MARKCGDKELKKLFKGDALNYSLYTIDDLVPGNHLCCIYETEEEHRALVTPFLRKGLELNQKVMYIVDTHTAEAILGYLADDGIDAKPYLEKGQLLILTKDESYTRNNTFDPDGMIKLLRSETGRTLAEGYTALRITGEMTWALRGQPGSDRLIEYESKLNHFFPDSKCLAICQYDKRRFSPTILMDVLHTHPIAVVGTKVCDNPFYIPPGQLLSRDLPAVKLDHWLHFLTERKQAAEALSDSEARFRYIVENVPMGICEIDLSKFKFMQVNRYMCDILGYTVEEFLSMNPEILFTGESKIHAVERIKKMRDSEKVPASFEYKMKTRDGRKIWILVNSRLIYENCKPARALVIAQDISERKQLEMKLRYAQKMETISNLADGIAHEFNNALMILSGGAETLQMRLPENEKVKKFAKITRNSIQRMVQLTDQLQAYARGGNYQSKTIDLADFVKGALLVIRHQLKPGIQVVTDIPRRVLNVLGDPAQLQMVISSIMQNASDAIEEEGLIRVAIRKEEVDREEAKKYPGFTEDTYISLVIEDNGRGMTEEIQAKIFDPFFTTKLQASGLSMSAVYGIVKNHGGFIYVESEVGKGTVIRIYFPPLEIERKKGKSSKKENIESLGTILVIDDEESILDVSHEMLENLGYRVLEAKSLRETLSIAKTHEGRIDVALLDIVMPDRGGKEIYPLLMEARPDMKVIVCTGYPLNGAAQEILDAGAQGFLKKPFSISALAQKLEEVLQTK